MLGLCAWREQDARTALHYSERAVAGADSAPPDAGPQVRSLAEAFAARYSLQLRDLVGAQRHLERALDWAERCGSERARSAAQVSQGLLQVHQGEIDDGLARLRRCVDEARVMQRDVLTGAIAALVEAYEHLNDPHNALAVLRQLMQVSRGKAMDAAIIRHQYGEVTAEAEAAHSLGAASVPDELSGLARRCQSLLAGPDLRS
jgi:lipopolysaccharide biosynthesis regulator YciM